MDPLAETRPPRTARLMVLSGLTMVLVLGLGITARLAHTATIPNMGLPVSNSKSLPNLAAYDPQVQVTRDYLQDLVTLNYAAAYQLLAPSTRARLSETDFEAARKAEGALGQPSVWADDQTSTRAEYVLGKPGASARPQRHRFVLKQEDGRWWIDQETPLASRLPAAPTLTAAMQQFVQQRAGTVWMRSIELLRQEGFEGGQLLLFSYIEPHPATVLTAERIAVLNYYVDASDGWHFEGGGATGLPAVMGLADVAMGFTTFGDNQAYEAYYGVIENTNAVSLRFEEPNGAGHTQNVKGQRTVLFVNERNPFEQPPFSQPFKSLRLTDVYGNSMRTMPDVGGATASG
jgi:hypothetical protein